MPKPAEPEVTKLRVKIGPHEFEAEGSRDVVAKHFETWMQVVVPRPPGEDTVRTPAVGDVAEREIFTADMQRHLITLRASLVGKAAFTDAAREITGCPDPAASCVRHDVPQGPPVRVC